MEHPYKKSKRVWSPHTNLKHLYSVIRKESGYMTVLGALLFLAVSGLLLVCMDGSLIYQAESRCSMAQTGLGEHLLANYNEMLAEEYELYFLDPRMTEENMEKRASLYYKELFSAGDGIFSKSLWRLFEKETEISRFGTLQENNCMNFMEQICDSVKYDAVKEVVFKMFDTSARDTEAQSEKIEDSLKELEEASSSIESSEQTGDTLKPSEPVPKEQLSDGVDGASPLMKIRSILEYGILGFVTDTDSLSERSIQPSLLPFQNLKEKGFLISFDTCKNLKDIKTIMEDQGLGELSQQRNSEGLGKLPQQTVNQKLNQLSKQASDRGMLSYYIAKHFNCFGNLIDQHNRDLLYEGEYILAGRDSDIENLEYVVNRIVMFRFVMNMAYACTDGALRDQAFTMAAGLTGIAGVPELVEAARYMILAALSLTESIYDVEELLDGKQVPIVKSSDSWKTSIDGAKKEWIKGNQGLSYQEYLMIFFLIDSDVNSICLRMQNLMELHIQKTEPDFQIKECVKGIKISSQIEGKTLFTGKRYMIEEVDSYEY